jgi:GT2 family glycosyltransferase
VRYAIVDAEATLPLPEVTLEADQQGVALLLRRDDRPVHFSMHPQAPGTHLDADALWALAARWAAPALLAQRIRDELAPPPAPVPPRLTIAVCTRARPQLLESCLRSVLAVLGEGDGAGADVLVVDNDPPDDATRDVVASLPGVRYAREPRAGLDFARNRAVHEARGEFVAFLDDDVVVDRGWLAGLAEALAENPDAGALTGLVLPYELESNAQVVFEARGGFRRGFEKRRYHGPRDPDNPLYPLGAGIFGAGANMVLRRGLVLELGGFDEALDTGPPLPGGGDLDIFYRVVAAGHPLVYEPSMLVFHRHRPEHEALRRQYWSWGEGFMAFLAKTRRADPSQRANARALVAWWAAYALRNVARSALRRDGSTPDLPLAELGGGLVGMAGSYRRSRRRTERIRSGHG